MDLLTIKQASKWASEYIKKDVTAANITYLVNYGRIQKAGENGSLYVSKQELEAYYKKLKESKINNWTSKLGTDLNWHLSFDQYKESETTKHVHRLHPYKGKFIPQLVEYFLDNHIDEFKKEVYFKKGDVILDPFCGSGTTLVQANELGINAIGVDVSYFNTLISNVKLKNYDFVDIQKEINRISEVLNKFLVKSHVVEFDEKLNEQLSAFNNRHFPAGEYRYKINMGLIDESKFSKSNLKKFDKIYQALIKKYKIKHKQRKTKSFLGKWYIKPVIDEIHVVFDEIKKIKNPDTKKIITVILSRTIRSCRATTHSDLATLLEPVTSIYYCTKHNKICKPLYSIKKMWDRYTKDTLSRLHYFKKLKTDTYQVCITDDSRTVDIVEKLNVKNEDFAKLVKRQKIAGIFSSPPYVGLIDYHEQHAYAYELFDFERKDELEIGPLSKGQGKLARDSYVESISQVLTNNKKYFKADFNVFLVANDKYNLYPQIAEKAGMKIVNQFKRPVLNRTEKGKGAYSETIFHLRKK